MKIVEAVFHKTIILNLFLMFILRIDRNKKKTGNIRKGTPNIEFEQDWPVGLGHGCAKVAHCVPAR